MIDIKIGDLILDVNNCEKIYIIDVFMFGPNKKYRVISWYEDECCVTSYDLVWANVQHYLIHLCEAKNG